MLKTENVNMLMSDTLKPMHKVHPLHSKGPVNIHKNGIEIFFELHGIVTTV